MDKLKIGPPMRFFFLISAAILWIGIGLTGFGQVSWILYFPAVFFVFAAATGICPGIIISNWLFGNRGENTDAPA